MPPWQLALSTIPVTGPALAPSLGMWVTCGYCLTWNCPWQGPSSCSLTTAGLLQRVQLKGLYLQALLGVHATCSGSAPKEKSSTGGAQTKTERTFYFQVMAQSCLEDFSPTNLGLHHNQTSALVCIALYLLYIDKYIEIGTIYGFETFTRMVLHTFTVSYGILKSHYLQWNSSSSLSCHLFSWSKWNLNLGGLQKRPRPSTES